MDEDEFIFTMEDDDLEVEFFPEPEITETVH
jgi:hypothetical protein